MIVLESPNYTSYSDEKEAKLCMVITIEKMRLRRNASLLDTGTCSMQAVDEK